MLAFLPDTYFLPTDMKFYKILIICFLFQNTATTQEAIFWVNPSFEGNPRYGNVPGGWRNCAFNSESPPDTHPVERGNYGVEQKAFDGSTYVGMVLRDNGSAESLGQMLPKSLEAGRCYTFSLYLCKSEHLMSRSRKTGGPADYNQPVSLKIWGGVSPCGQKEMLAVSVAISHAGWEKYDFHFQPRSSLNWISFEVAIPGEGTEPYNGNILIDHATPILPMNCSTGELLVNIDTLQIPVYEFEYAGPSGGGSNAGKRPGKAYRVVKSEEELKEMVQVNFPLSGFDGGRLVPREEAGLREILFNLPAFPSQKLLFGLPDNGRKLNNKRKKAILNLVRSMQTPDQQYDIVTGDAASFEKGGWDCGAGLLCLWLVSE